MKVFGREYTRAELEARTGSIAQLCGAKTVRFAEGLERGTAAIHVWNAAGLQFWVLPDRGMDIGMIHYKGLPLAWRSKTGYVNPAYLQREGWPKGFHGGLLATCGLNNVGPRCRDSDGTDCEQHGSISRTPASRAGFRGFWQGDEYRIVVEGTVDDADSRGRHLQLHRTIELAGDGLTIAITDRIANLGVRSEPCMLLYHMNFGFPFIDADAVFEAEGTRRALLAAGVEEPVAPYDAVRFPTELKQAQLLYYESDCRTEEWGRVEMRSPATGFAAAIEYTRRTLPHLWRWNQFTDGLHVCAVEPSNCRIKPRFEARTRGELPMLEAGQTEHYGIKFSIGEIRRGGGKS